MDADQQLGEFWFNSLKIFFRKGTEDEKVLSHSFDNDIFFKEIPSFKPQKNPVIVDVGAHIGTFSILSAIKFPQARIFSIEASKETFDILQKNIDENHLPIQASHNALLDREEKVRLYHSSKTGNWGHSVTKELSNSFEEVDSVSLNLFIKENEIDFIDLIKFNCEGAEFDVLLNTNEGVLRKIGLAIILYHEDLSSSGYTLNDLLPLFKPESFRVICIARGNKRGWLIVWNKKIYSHSYFFLSAFKRRLNKWMGL
jgi:FkbM family methyltransferase